MALKDQVVELVLRARNLLSKDTDAAAKSVDELAGNADGLTKKLRSLQDQATLIKQFDRAAKAVDTTAAAYDRAEARLDKLKATLDTTGPPTERQAKDFAAAQAAVDRAEKAYRSAEGTLGKLAKEAEEAGVDITDLAGAQRENQRETTQAKRALEDYNKEIAKGEGPLKRFGKSLASGALSLGKWVAAVGAAGAAGTAGLLTRMTANQAELARQTIAAADAFGISTQALQEWRYAADTVGIEGDKVADIMKDVSDKIGDAFLNGTGAAVDIIKELNLDLEELVRLSPDEQLLAISEQLQGMPKPAQVQILESLAGDASKLLPLLENNADALRQLSEEAQKRGVLLSDEELQRLADADKAFDRIRDQMVAFKNRIAGELAPTLTDLANEIDAFLTSNPQLIEDIAAAFRGLIEHTKEWVTGLINSQDKLDKVADSAKGVLNAFQVLGSGVKAVFSALMTPVTAFGTVVSMQGAALLSLVEAVTSGLNKIGVVSDEAVADAQARADKAWAVMDRLAGATKGWVVNIGEAGKEIADVFSGAADGASRAQEETDRLKTSTEGQAAAVRELADAQIQAAIQAGDLDRANGLLLIALNNTREALEEAQKQYQKDPSEEQAQKVQGLKQRYEELDATLSNLTVPDLSGADVANETMGQLADKTEAAATNQAELGRQIAETVRALEAANAAWSADPSEENLERVEQLRAKYNQLQDALAGLAVPPLDGADDAAESLDNLAGKAKQAAEAVEQTAGKVAVLTNETRAAGAGAQEAGAAALSAAEDAGSAVASIFDGWAGRMDQLSAKASAAFSRAIGNTGASGDASNLNSRLEAANEQLDQLRKNVSSSQITLSMSRIARQGLDIERQFLSQARAVEEMTARIQDGDRSAGVLRMTVDGIRQQFDLLDDQQLTGLFGAVSAVQREVDSLRESLNDTINSLRQELASLRGDTAQVEELRYLEKRQELEAQYQYARRLGDRETQDAARQALHLLEQAHQIRVQDAKEQDAAARKAAAAQAAEEEQRRQLDEREERQDISRQTAQQLGSRSTSQTTRVVELRVVGQNGQQLATLNAVDDGNLENFLDAIERSAYLAPGR
ncbi:MAG: hypothetical protein CME38_08745 [Haliea sp.]|nr:hypothetical protein [Haliea sp.]